MRHAPTRSIGAAARESVKSCDFVTLGWLAAGGKGTGCAVFPMAIEFHIDAERRVVFLKECGIVTFADRREVSARLLRSPLFRAEFDRMVDCRAASAMDLSAAEIRELAVRSVSQCRGRVAVVVATSEQHGVSRMLAAHRDFAGGAETLVVWNLAEALAWLGLPADFDPVALPAVSAAAAGSTDSVLQTA